MFPDILCTRVLRAKYYPHGRLEDTIFRSNPSSTWQGIGYGLELLKKSLIWRVGNGTKINIWRDNWTARSTSQNVVSWKGRCRLKWVYDMLDVNGGWNPTIVHQHIPLDAHEILKIKPCSRNYDDLLSWVREKSRNFTVRSTDRMALEERQQSEQHASNSSPSGDRGSLWKHVLGGCTPP